MSQWCEFKLNESNPSKAALQERIRELDQELESSLRARGFDPAQLENLPLTPALARIKAERDDLIETLKTLVGQDN